MSTKTVRVLAVVAFALYATVLLLTGLGTLLQAPLKRLLITSQDAVAFHSVPVPLLTDALVMTGLSLWHMLSALRCRSRRASRVRVIVVAVLLLVWRALLSPLFGSLWQFLRGRMIGSVALAADSALNTVLSLFFSPMSITALVLMVLSMGAFFGRGEPDLPVSGETPAP